ncbi:2-dehydro-3-deoxygalactonokinase [Nitratireductor sp. XY-223]|uniref:2-dehydro-3-deoxygalactonokinase n=1 Tax=Nitratireductor sp. XY-223 TaxID=2561926 RepID=UPI0010AA7E02|nr:2-dehydro-3-deoxygalactonokinase [Nitratireductor sp. XY-223]
MDVFCAAVDWGTTSFRLWALDAVGRAVAELRSDCGMSGLRPDEFQGRLEEGLAELALPEDLPVIACGMVGSAQGWKEAPYVDIPARLDAFPRQAISISSRKREVCILPGLSQRNPSSPDVMRGEETLLLGAALAGCTDGIVCLPGTHSKWVRLESGRVAAFATAMTGEVFSLLERNSTLSHFIDADAKHASNGVFADAVRASVNAPSDILRTLFSLRAAPLLDCAERSDGAARLSGLLIGLEIAGMRDDTNRKLTLISSGALCRNYSLALATAGIDHTCLDASEMARSGLYHAAGRIWTRRLQQFGSTGSYCTEVGVLS